MNNYLVSIIIPIYNVEEYLPQCLDSIINQTMKNIEIILVDDCGTDNSVVIAEQYAMRDARIKIIRHMVNQGLSAARNSGIDNSTAPYILFVDSDDYVEADYCEKLYQAIVSSDADIAMCGVFLFGERHKKTRRLKKYFNFQFPNETALTSVVIGKTNCCVWNKIYRRSIIVENCLRFPVGLKHEDEYWWRIYTLYSQRMVYIEEALYHYRQRAGSIMGDIRKAKILKDDKLRIGMAFYEEIKKRGITTKREFAIGFFLKMLAFNLRHSHYDNRDALIDEAISFVKREHITEMDCSFKDQHVLQLLYSRRLETVQKRFGGLIVIKEMHDRRRIEWLGIPVWVSKYKEDRVVHTLFGAIPFFEKRKHEKSCF